MNAREKMVHEICEPNKEGKRFNISWEMANLIADKLINAGYYLISELTPISDQEIIAVWENAALEYNRNTKPQNQNDVDRFKFILSQELKAQLAAEQKKLEAL